MKVALLTTDNREHYRNYSETIPYFGSAPEALMQGFAQLPELEVHVISCTQKQMKSPEKLAKNIFFHSLYVPKIGWMRTLYQGCIRATRKKLKEIQPNIVHGQGTEKRALILLGYHTARGDEDGVETAEFPVEGDRHRPGRGDVEECPPGCR